MAKPVPVPEDPVPIPPDSWQTPGAGSTYEIPLADISPHPRNPRRGDIDLIAESLRVNGQYRPIVVQLYTGFILAGNHTAIAAGRLGWTHILGVYVDVDDVAALRILLADNRTADVATYEFDELDALLRSFEGDLEGTGWTSESAARELGRLISDSESPFAAVPRPSGGSAPIDAVPVRVSPGDRWQLGRHVLVCGDALEEANYPEEKPSLILTDPPYGVDVAGKNRFLARGSKEIEDMAGDLTPDVAIAACELLRGYSRPGTPWLVFSGGGRSGTELAAALSKLGVFRWFLVWCKDDPVLGRSDFLNQFELMQFGSTPGVLGPEESQFEFVQYGWTPGAAHRTPNHRRANVFHHDRPAVNPFHPTMKPVPLIEELVRLFSTPDALVLDPFVGAGSLVLACEGSGRRAWAIELKPRFCDVVLFRWEEASGLRAEKISEKTPATT